MSNPNPAGATPEQLERMSKEWSQEQYTKAMVYLQNKGFTGGKIIQSESRILPPLVALWRFEGHAEHKKHELWVITGDLPHDHITVETAPAARDALRHFSLSWQLKAANLEKALDANRVEVGSPQTQREFAQNLIQSAERLHQLVQADHLWPNEKI